MPLCAKADLTAAARFASYGESRRALAKAEGRLYGVVILLSQEPPRRARRIDDHDDIRFGYES
jgi:hypothetical protein